MKCPIDATDLVMSERQGVEIDYCPQCRGVWLDRGELDKIIDRASEMTAGTAAPTGSSAPAGQATGAPVAPGPFPPSPAPPGPYPPGPSGQPYRDDRYREDRYREDRYRDEKYRDDRYRDGYRDQYGRPYRKKKESWLGELFDF